MAKKIAARFARRFFGLFSTFFCEIFAKWPWKVEISRILRPNLLDPSLSRIVQRPWMDEVTAIFPILWCLLLKLQKNPCIPSCVSSWVLTLKKSPQKIINVGNSVSLSVCQSVRGISHRRSALIEKMMRSKVVPNFPRMIPTPLIFFRASLVHARNAFLRFRHYDEVPEGGFESKKWGEANLFVTPRKPTYSHDKSRASLVHARHAFLRFGPHEEVPEGGFESKKWREANLFVTPRKNTFYHGKPRAAPTHARSALFRFCHARSAFLCFRYC